MNPEIMALEDEISSLRMKLTEMKRAEGADEVQDYTLKTVAGDARLSSLFGDKRDLIVIHNMGKSCPYCTLWADGINGVMDHIQDRAALVLVSPDAPAVQAEFAASRDWKFPLASAEGSGFIEDMGFKSERGWLPGFSTFQKKADGTIVRVGSGGFGPGDEYCSVWHFFDHLADGPNGWQPRFAYS